MKKRTDLRSERREDRLQVGVDARVLTETTPMGVSRCVTALLLMAAALEPQHEYCLYLCGRSLPQASFSVRPFHQRVLAGNAVLMNPLVWQQLYFPWRAWRDGVDVLFSPYYCGPLFSPVPQVVCIHDISFSVFPQDFPSWVYFKPKVLARPSSRRAARVMTVSEFSRQEIIRVYGLAPEKVVAIPHGHENCFWQRSSSSTEELPVRVDSPFFLFVGSLLPRRQVSSVIQAFAQLPAQYRFVLVGESDPAKRKKLMETAQHWNLADRVHCLGHISDEALDDLYQRALALVSPSTYEGFGLPVLEAMTRGLPVIGWDIPVMREVAGGAAILLQSGDVEGLATAMLRVGTEPAVRHALCRMGKERALQFSWRRSAATLLSVLRDAAAERQARA